jgi:hypothetical protein
MRETIHYALTLGRWFEMEAKNCDSVENLWSDFQLVLLKLNFVRANLTLVDGRREWKRNDAVDQLVALAWIHREFTIGEDFSVEFAIESDALNPSLFYHLSDIVAEAWHNAVASWCKRHCLPLRFNSRAFHNSARRMSQAGRAYVPLVWGQSASLQSPRPAIAGSVESL